MNRFSLKSSLVWPSTTASNSGQPFSPASCLCRPVSRNTSSASSPEVARVSDVMCHILNLSMFLTTCSYCILDVEVCGHSVKRERKEFPPPLLRVLSYLNHRVLVLQYPNTNHILPCETTCS